MPTAKAKAKVVSAARPKSEARVKEKATPEKAAEDANPVWQQLAMRQWMAGAQGKLSVSSPDDPSERDADRTAERVMTMTTPTEGGAPAPATPASYGVSRMCGRCEEEEERQLRRKERGGDAPAPAPPVVHEALNSAGEPLDANTRAFFEPRFGRDFGTVRVHRDGQAAESAKAVNALAYTVGRDIVFGAAQYRPGTGAGLHLLAHELTHVAQQDQSGARRPAPGAQAGGASRPLIAPEHSPAEREADEQARRVLLGGSAAGRTRSAPAGSIHRSVQIDPTDAQLGILIDTLMRLTGRMASAPGGTLTLGAAVPGVQSSATASEYIQRAVSAARVYTLRSGTTTPGGQPVHGVGSEVTTTGVTITLNTADVGAFTWTAAELVSEGFVKAVSANDRTTQTFPPAATGGATTTAGTNLDDLLAATLPFANSSQRTTAMTLIRQRVPAVAADPLLEVDVDAALQSARGVTLAEILRGLETNTAFRIVQERDGDRIRATYFDPRRTPGAGEHQRLPQRNVTFPAGPGRAAAGAAPLRQQDLGMAPAQVAQANASCTTTALGEIRAHVSTAQSLITRAVARLASQENLDAALTAHFGRTGPSNRARIAANFRVILSEMDFSRHSWVCTARGSGQGCNTPGVTGRTGIANPAVQLCIEQSAPLVPRATTVLHEVVHASGVGTLAAGTEQYSWQPGYPGSDPLHNADSYAQFAAAIGTGPVQVTPPPTQQPPQPAPGEKRGSLDEDAPESGALAAAEPPMLLQRATGHGTEEMHHAIAEEYRRRHGLPAGGVDEFGRRAGPTDSQIAHGALLFPVPLSELAAMSPWELASVAPERLVPEPGATPPASGPNYRDYVRARQVVQYLHGFFGLTYDYERDNGVKGRPPNPQELQTLDQNLAQLLSTFNVRGHVAGAGGRGIPTAPGGTTATLEGRVSLVASNGDFAGKRYQLERWAGATRTLNTPAGEADRLVRAQWADTATGVTAAPTEPVTEPERVAVVWANTAAGISLEPAFFFPREDRFYLSSRVNLSTLEGQDVARHETVHLLGGGERTRQAFITRFGADWKTYWKPFEEGMAEFVNISSRTPAQTPPSAGGGGTLGSAYGPYYAKVQRLIADPAFGRDAVLRAYFTGSVSADMFRRWQAIVDAP